MSSGTQLFGMNAAFRKRIYGLGWWYWDQSPFMLALYVCLYSFADPHITKQGLQGVHGQYTAVARIFIQFTELFRVRGCKTT